MENLAEIGACVFVHYSCDMFQVGERIFAIGVRANEKTTIWSATNEQEEITAIQSLYDYLIKCPQKILVHWNMDKYEFGHQHLERRYRQLSGLELPKVDSKWVNLTEYLWEKYGEYAPHPRLKILCEMNQIKLYGSHIDPDNYNTAQAKSYKVVTHLAAIERIYYKEERGMLVVDKPKPTSNPKREQQQAICSFCELLKEPSELPQYIQAFHTFTERNKIVVIDKNGRFIKRKGNKSILLAWSDTLKIKGKYRQEVTDKEFAKLLNIQFPGLDIDTNDPSIIRKSTSAKSNYQAEFLALIK